MRTLQTATPAPALMGGFAEDALLYGGSSREHNDIDFLVERSSLEGLLDQLREFGFDDWVTKGETATGDPFYLEQGVDGLLIEIGVTDRSARGESFLEIGRVHYTLATGEAPVGYRVYLPADTYDYPVATYEGIRVRCISPLANYQLRAGIGSRGTFGELRPHDHVAMERLRETFFPDVDAARLQPRVEDL